MLRRSRLVPIFGERPYTDAITDMASTTRLMRRQGNEHQADSFRGRPSGSPCPDGAAVGAEIGTPKGNELDVLALLIERYEAKHFPMPPADPIEIID